ncbi:MAG: GNAT family N-acetyltransferase [Clostridia bacterium]|nr:GNAT family N-acetyltransferase [Clostridia bacterium]
MIRSRWFPQGSDITVPLGIRRDVFSRGRDRLDREAQQVVVYKNDLPVAAARLWWAEDSFHLGDVGVLAGERGKGYGDLLVRLALHKARLHDARRVRAAATRDTAAFFARYGFRPEGEEGPGVPMCLLGKDIRLESCGSAGDGDYHCGPG